MRIIPDDYQIALGEHNDKSVIWLQFPYDGEKVKAAREAGAKWSNARKS